jgi:hypothetical protein
VSVLKKKMAQKEKAQQPTSVLGGKVRQKNVVNLGQPQFVLVAKSLRAVAAIKQRPV